MRFAQTDARVRLGASWAALGRLADLELAHAVELHQQGGAARGPLAALAAHLTRLSLQARMLNFNSPSIPLRGRALRAARCLERRPGRQRSGPRAPPGACAAAFLAHGWRGGLWRVRRAVTRARRAASSRAEAAELDIRSGGYLILTLHRARWPRLRSWTWCPTACAARAWRAARWPPAAQRAAPRWPRSRWSGRAWRCRTCPAWRRCGGCTWAGAARRARARLPRAGASLQGRPCRGVPRLRRGAGVGLWSPELGAGGPRAAR